MNVQIIPIHYKHTMNPSFPRRRESIPPSHIYGLITTTWYNLLPCKEGKAAPWRPSDVGQTNRTGSSEVPVHRSLGMLGFLTSPYASVFYAPRFGDVSFAFKVEIVE